MQPNPPIDITHDIDNILLLDEYALGDRNFDEWKGELVKIYKRRGYKGKFQGEELR
jgi:hypothetical protein